MAFAPAEAPKIAVAVLVENGKHGSAAGLIARKVLDAYLLPPEVVPAATPVTPPAGGAEE